MRVIAPILLLFALLVGSLVADRPEPPVDITVSYTDIKTADGQMMQAMEDIRFGYALYEGLLGFNPHTFTIIPGVAEKWEISDDKRTYTFHLRKNAKWSDGTPFTAEDFRFSWRIGLMPDTGTKYVDFLYKIKGGAAFAKWCAEELEKLPRIQKGDSAEIKKQKLDRAHQRITDSEAKFDELVGVKVIDDHTLEVKSEGFIPYFEEVIACWPLWPLPRHILSNPEVKLAGKPVMYVDEGSLMLRRNQQWTKGDNKPNTMVTNGPFRLKYWRFKRDILLEANEHYWNAASVEPKTFRLISCKDVKTNYDTYTSGAAQAMYDAQGLTFAPDMLAAQRAGKRNDVSESDSYGTYYYCFNTSPTLPDGSKNPFADKRVRQAFSLVVDKQAIVEKVTRLRQTVARTYINKGWLEGYNPPEGFPSLSDAKDEAGRSAMVASAKQLLAEAGYPNASGFPPVKILVNTGAGHEAVAQALRNMWEKNLGVAANLETQEWKVMLTRRSEGQFMIARSGWNGDYMDPTTFLELFQRGNGNNDGKFSDDKYEELLGKAAVTLDPKERYRILEEAERYICDDQLPGIPLYYYKKIHLYDPDKLEGVSHHARDIQMYHLYKNKNKPKP